VTHETAVAGISAGLIKLTPPLPFVSKQFGYGFVDAIGRDRLIIHPAPESKSPSVDGQGDIKISMPDGAQLEIRAKLQQPEGERLLMLTDGPEASRSLHEILNSVRKQQHIDLCRDADVESSDRFTGFDHFALAPCALPELNWQSIDTRQEFLGRQFAMPVLITGMTGGVEQGETINRRLARAAQKFNIPMGVGSQRLALENREYQRIFRVKEFAPEVFLIGNMGMAQLAEHDYLDQCRRAVEMIQADAFAIHLNCLQEMIQEEGDRDFAGLADRIGVLVEKLGVPVMVKEVGVGIDVATARLLTKMGVSAIDVGGRGGTSWARIEGLRSADPRTAALGEQFRDWGIPTAYALRSVVQKVKGAPALVATGGIRNGVTVAKAVGLGARMAGIGLPLMRSALIGERAVEVFLEDLHRSLKIAMMCSGAAALRELSKRTVEAARYGVLADGGMDPDV
jgi:isopentenyl-diphosphate delta-isomerase